MMKVSSYIMTEYKILRKVYSYIMSKCKINKNFYLYILNKQLFLQKESSHILFMCYFYHFVLRYI